MTASFILKLPLTIGWIRNNNMNFNKLLLNSHER